MNREIFTITISIQSILATKKKKKKQQTSVLYFPSKKKSISFGVQTENENNCHQMFCANNKKNDEEREQWQQQHTCISGTHVYFCRG